MSSNPVTIRLGDVCAISASAKENPDEYVWLLNLDMGEQQTGRVLQYVYVPKEEAVGSIIRFDTDNVLYSKLRPNLNKVVLPVKDGFATSELLPLRPNTTVLSKEYLATYLRSSIFVAWATSKATGAKMPRLASKELLNKTIPLPSIAEQKRIASVIGTVDNLIAFHKRQLAKLDELVKARFVELFCNLANGDSLPIYKLGELCEIGSSKRIYQQEQTNKGIPFLRVSDLVAKIEGKAISPSLFISANQFQDLKEKNLVPLPGNILVTSRGTIGKCYIVQENDEFYFQDGMISWLYHFSDSVMSPYIAYLFSTSSFQKQVQELQAGSTVAYLSIAMLNKLNVALPPLNLQKRFVAFVRQSEKSRLTIQQGLDKMETLKRALMQEYFG